MPELDIVIPAAGAGRRMRSYGPKALIRLGEETLVARQLRLLRECYPGARVAVVAGFAAERLRRALGKDVAVLVNPDFETCNVARSVALGLAAGRKGASALVVYGDLVFNREAVAGLDPSRSWAVVDDGRGRESEVGVNVVDRLVCHFSYGLPRKWAHICLLAPRERALFLAHARRAHRRRLFGYEVLNEVLDAGGELHAHAPPGMRLAEIDCSRDIAGARRVC